MTNQKGFASLLMVILLVLGIGVAVYLTQFTQVFKPKASESGTGSSASLCSAAAPGIQVCPNILPSPSPVASPVSAAVCTKLEKNSLGSGFVVSGGSTTVRMGETVSIVGTFGNANFSAGDFQWYQDGRLLNKSSASDWDRVDWVAPTTLGSYNLSVKVKGVEQTECRAIFSVTPEVCSRLDRNQANSGLVLSGGSTQVKFSETVKIAAVFGGDVSNLSGNNFKWQSPSGGSLVNSDWSRTDWIAPSVPGIYPVTMNVVGKPQSQCVAQFVVAEPICTELFTESLGSKVVLSGSGSGGSTTVQKGQKITIKNSISGAINTDTDVIWDGDGGEITNKTWNQIDWVTQSPGIRTISLKLFGKDQPACRAVISVP